MTTSNSITEMSVVNQALSRMGSTQQITSFADGSNEAQQSLLWYPQTRDSMLCDFPWPWAERYAVLDQVAGPEIDGNLASAQWSRSYRYPGDCLVMRRLMNTPPPPGQTTPPQTTGLSAQFPYYNQPWNRPVGDAYPLSYGESSDSTGRLLMTDNFGLNGLGLTAIYTAAVADPSQFQADFADALAWRLGMELAMGLGFSDTRRQYAEGMYERVIRKARAAAMNQMQSDIPSVGWQSETTRARWGGFPGGAGGW